MIRNYLNKSRPLLDHDRLFNALRKKEYNRLDKQNQIYLDYTGGNLFGISQLNTHQKLLKSNVLGNPHSINPTSQLASDRVKEARQAVIDYFNASDYFCVFTQNASGALKIIGECFPFCEESSYLLLADNHNSVNGIREYCKGKKGHFYYSPLNVEDLTLNTAELDQNLRSKKKPKNNLFAFPAQSNVSGVKHSLDWIEKAQSLGWDVLLDAAAFVPTSKLDLKVYSPDFVTLSFYKIFGYPTGLGCLLIKKSKMDVLKKPWFAGGTVAITSVGYDDHILHQDHERFENGTINYLDIPAIKIGLDYINKIGIETINARVAALTSYLVDKLNSLKHDNGTSQLTIFGPKDRSRLGATIVMVFKNPDCSNVPYQTIERLAAMQNISIRGGCFCNPGIDELNSCISTEELASYFVAKEGIDDATFMQQIKKYRGGIRVSLGLATVYKDLNVYINFVRSLANKQLD